MFMATPENSKPAYPPHRRKYDRLPANFFLDFSCGGACHTGTVTDISLGGLRVKTLKKLTPGCQVLISLQTNPPLKIKGVVKWSNKKGFRWFSGIQFRDVSMEQDFRLREVIHSIYWETAQPYDR